MVIDLEEINDHYILVIRSFSKDKYCENETFGHVSLWALLKMLEGVDVTRSS